MLRWYWKDFSTQTTTVNSKLIKPFDTEVILSSCRSQAIAPTYSGVSFTGEHTRVDTS